MSAIKLTDVSSGYGQLSVLHSVSMEIEAGEIVAIIGPNGAGKSTLMRAIFRLLPLHNGSIRFGDTELGNLATGRLAQLGMALVPQGGNTFPDLSVVDNLSLGLLQASAKEQAERIDDVFKTFPALADRRRQRASTLSGGERQMLAMASAMITDPKFLALDEPTTGLAPSIVRDRIDDILSYRERGTTVLWVIEESPLLCLPHVDRVYVMNSGVLSESRSAADLLDESALQAMFFGVADETDPASPTE